MEVIFLGTGSMVPTRERNHSGYLILHNEESILVDCGEGTQRQLRFAGISPTKITRILITHWHGDHVLGLPGLLQSMMANEYHGTVNIYCPEGTGQFFERMWNSFAIQKGSMEIKLHEIKERHFLKASDLSIESLPMKHSTKCNAYSFKQEDKRKINLDYLKKFGLVKDPILKDLQRGKDIKWKGQLIKASDATFLKAGKKLTLVTDTMANDNIVELARDSDVFICEATFSKSMEEKAKEHMHMTSAQAAELAKKANVKKLILTHFSQRYKSVNDHKKEASKIFKNVVCAKDLMRITV